MQDQAFHRLFGKSTFVIRVNNAKGVHCSTQARSVICRAGPNFQGVFEGVVMGVARASFGNRAPLTPQPRRASARRRQENCSTMDRDHLGEE